MDTINPFGSSRLGLMVVGQLAVGGCKSAPEPEAAVEVRARR